MPLKTFLPLLAGVALLCTTLMSVLGVLFDFRIKESNRLTKPGRYVITVTLFTCFVGMTSVVADAIKKQQESQEAAAQTLRIVKGIERTLSPLSEIKIQVLFEVTPPSSPKKSCRSEDERQLSSTWGFADRSKWSTIAKYSPTWRIEEVTREVTARVFLFRTPIDPKTFPLAKVIGLECEFAGDQRFGGGSGCPDARITADRNTENVALAVQGCRGGDRVAVEKTVSRLQTNGRMSSLLDLEGSQIVILAEGLPFEPNLDDVEMQLGQRPHILLSKDKWTLYNLTNSWQGRASTYAIYAHDFSKTELNACCENSAASPDSK